MEGGCRRLDQIMDAELPTKKRDKARPIKVLVTDDERAAIERGASAVAMPPSTYLRNLGAGHVPKSTLDQQAILALMKVNADQGRLGGLFKLWLTGADNKDALTITIRKLLKEIEDTQKTLRALIDRL
jgi:hypothetical protein